MSIRRTDPRFGLAEPPQCAVVIDGLAGWTQGLEEAGIEVRAAGPADVVVAHASSVREALAVGARSVVLEGRGGRRALERAGLQAQAVLVRPRVERPETLIPLSDRRAAAYAIGNWSAGDSRRKRLRNRAAAGLAGRGLLPTFDPVVALGNPRTAKPSPYLVQAAAALGVPEDAEWFMTCGHGDALSRNVFQLFPRGRDVPAWVLKYARVRGYDDPFVRDERGLNLAANAGATVAARAPRLLGRFTADGVEASVETAAPGRRLRAALLAPVAEREKLRLVDEVAAWLLAVARETAAPAGALEGELERLVRDVVPAWAPHGATPDLVASLPRLPAVLQHNDMGCWNVVVSDSGFTAVDWESAREHGLPLWDLVYFLTDALVTLERPASAREQDELTQDLLSGRASRSGVLFAWVARAARELEIPSDSVGAIVTLGWLHHALSREHRAETMDRVGRSDPVEPAPVGRLAVTWLADPALGDGWRAWRAA